MNRPAHLLPDETWHRLTALAKRTGRSPEAHLREAVEAHLDDADDLLETEKVLERIARGEELVSPLEEVERRLGLAD